MIGRNTHLCAKSVKGVSSGSLLSISSALTNCGRSLRKLVIRSLSINVCMDHHILMVKTRTQNLLKMLKFKYTSTNLRSLFRRRRRIVTAYLSLIVKVKWMYLSTVSVHSEKLKQRFDAISGLKQLQR